MALINCPECSKEVSSKAPACPNCGVVLNKSTTEKVHSVIWEWWMGLLYILGFALIGAPIYLIISTLILDLADDGWYRNARPAVLVPWFSFGLFLHCTIWWAIIRRRKKSQR